MAQTLQQRMEQAPHIQIDDEPYPLTRCHCRRCGESIPVDYFMFGSAEMTRMMASFVAKHKTCPVPRVVTLDASLEAGIARAKTRQYATRGKR